MGIASKAKLRGVMVVALVLAARSSKANAATETDQTENPPPSFLTLDRMDEASRFGIQVGFDKIDRVGLSDGFITRAEIYGQYVFPESLGGVYLHVPFGHYFNFDGSDHTSMGNVDLGGFILPTHGSDLILRVGLVLPTASDDDARVVTNVIGGYERLTDLLLVPNDHATIRVSASTLQERGALFFRGDFGFDLVMDKPSSAGDAPSVYVRANLAGGVHVDPVDLTLELVNWGALNGDVSGGIENRFLHTLAAGLSTRGTDQFRLGTVFPLDKEVRGEIWIVSLGYQHATN